MSWCTLDILQCDTLRWLLAIYERWAELAKQTDCVKIVFLTQECQINSQPSVYGGAGEIWTPVHEPFSSSSTCVAVWFKSRLLHRAVARFAKRQQPIFSTRLKLPKTGPAKWDYPAAWTVVPCDTTTLAQPIGLLLRGSRAIKRRVRNVRRLQLVFLNLFYERIQLDMPCCASVPTSKPVQPQVCHFRPCRAIATGPPEN